MLNVRLTYNGQDFAVLLPVSEKQLSKIKNKIPEDAEIVEIFIVSQDKDILDIGEVSDPSLEYLNEMAIKLLNNQSEDRKRIFDDLASGVSLEKSLNL